MKRVIRLTESDLVRIVKRVINEQENDISNIDRIRDIPEVATKAFKVNPNAINNVEKLNYVIYNSETGEVLGRLNGATTNVVLTKTKPNLSSDEFKKWLSTDPVLSAEPVEKVTTLPEVGLKAFSLNPKSPSNPDKISAVKYDSETGDVMDATNNTVIASTQPNLTDEQFIEWLKRNKLRKKRQ